MCIPPDPALLDHEEKCEDGYVGLTCGNCYSPFDDPTDGCFEDPTYTQEGLNAKGVNETLNCDRRYAQTQTNCKTMAHCVDVVEYCCLCVYVVVVVVVLGTHSLFVLSASFLYSTL